MKKQQKKKKTKNKNTEIMKARLQYSLLFLLQVMFVRFESLKSEQLSKKPEVASCRYSSSL